MRNVVKRDGSRLVMTGREGKGAKLNDYALRNLLSELHNAVRRKGYEDLVLDFTQCVRAYPGPMIGLICLVDHYRSEGVDFSLLPPSDDQMMRLFRNADWAHHIDPSRFEAGQFASKKHMPARRFQDHDEQHQVVADVLDVVMRQMSISRDELSGFEWSFNEITDNVLNHAAAKSGGLVQVTTMSSGVNFVVGDTGQGIPSSMRLAFPRLTRDIDAIGEAVKQGVTSRPDYGQGNGLAGTLKISSESQGKFVLTSGRGEFSVRKGELQTFHRKSNMMFPGTLIDAEIGVGSEFDLGKALRLGGDADYRPHDVIEEKYEQEDGSLMFDLAAETTGFGTRRSGQEIRTKVENILRAEPSKPLMLDWSGVPLVSSSFADEFVGKLYLGLGPIGFGQRIRQTGMQPIVRDLIDRAVVQRLAHAVSGSADE